MAYSTHLKSKPTGGNQRAAAELAPAFAADALRAISSAAEALAALSKTTNPSPEQVLSAVLTWHVGQQEIQRPVHELLGCAVLGGQSVSTTATKLSVRPQTLSSWLAGTVARWRGTEMKHAGKGVWEPLRFADQQVSGPAVTNGPGDDAPSAASDGPSMSADAAGMGRNTVGAGSVTVGAAGLSDADHAELDRLGVDVDTVIDAAIGGA